MASKPRNLGELRSSGYRDESVKDEMRRNLIARLKGRERLFPGILGYDDSVIPQIVNAILARHDMILLGLRGQAKSRTVRALTDLLDDELPIIAGSEVNDHPYHPISKHGRDLIAEKGDSTPIEWIPRDARYGEKLATPDVTMSDLIGDIDPIKAATQRLHYAHEGVIHFGMIPRVNRGIFAMNEIPDLQPRIQVGLFNILEENDVQIRGFPVRMPLDVQIVFTANPEDYTHRGNLITPLKDRIGSQILTHYPRTPEIAKAITRQEAWSEREDGPKVHVPELFREIIEQIAFEARESEYVDHKSGVSARLSIACMEALVSNVERRALLGENGSATPRVADLCALAPAITGKIELVYEGEQEGELKVAHGLIARAVRKVFDTVFPAPDSGRKRRQKARSPFGEEGDMDVDLDMGAIAAVDEYYSEILAWFDEGNNLLISDTMSDEEYAQSLDQVPGLRRIAESARPELARDVEIHTLMELLAEGLHVHSRLSKDKLTEGRSLYRDIMSELYTRGGK